MFLRILIIREKIFELEYFGELEFLSENNLGKEPTDNSYCGYIPACGCRQLHVPSRKGPACCSETHLSKQAFNQLHFSHVVNIHISQLSSRQKRNKVTSIKKGHQTNAQLTVNFLYAWQIYPSYNVQYTLVIHIDKMVVNFFFCNSASEVVWTFFVMKTKK